MGDAQRPASVRRRYGRPYASRRVAALDRLRHVGRPGADQDPAPPVPRSRREDTLARYRRGAGRHCQVSRGPGERMTLRTGRGPSSVGCVGRGGGPRGSPSSDGCARDRRRPAHGRGPGVDDRARGRRSRARGRPACHPEISPDGTAVIFYGDGRLRGGGALRRLNNSHQNPCAPAVSETQDSGLPTRGRSCLPTGPT